ncbi:OmpA family protein [Shewanella cyperi]|uniref:OmpA family protein n=1 Tax=Shewanella cyperi TaxID=2814292 RepID=UPI001A93F176|nr:OmpA family protein [Shewanella cyperi]QSX41755.1 OmpA family protein [Shewanella cyperi]
MRESSIAVLLVVLLLVSHIQPAWGWNDEDGDGVPDLKDACPATELKAKVSANGCVVAPVAEVPDLCLMTTRDSLFPPQCEHTSAVTVYFDFAVAKLGYDQAWPLAKVADFIKRHGKAVYLVGHTDNIGSHEANQALSLARADHVRLLLEADFAVDPALLFIEGRGSNEPVEAGDSPLARKLNRRVEFLVDAE